MGVTGLEPVEQLDTRTKVISDSNPRNRELPGTFEAIRRRPGGPGDRLRPADVQRPKDGAATISKIAKWHALKAGVGVCKSQGNRDALNGMTSRMSPRAYRRAWATIALNETELPIDIVSEVLNHSDIATTRRHCAPTKSERARAALVGMRLP